MRHAKGHGMKILFEHAPEELARAAEKVLDASWEEVEDFSPEEQTAVLTIALMCVVSNIKEPTKAIGAAVKMLKSHDFSSYDSDRWFPNRTWGDKCAEKIELS